MLVLQLDTRASELKVDGFKALVREDPAEQLRRARRRHRHARGDAGRAGRRSSSTGDARRPRWPTLEDSYGAYTDAITAFVDSAVADQAGTRVRWEEIQAANDLTDGAVGAAKDALIADTAAAEEELLAAALDRSQIDHD